MEAEKMDYHIEAGEGYAPVSSVYKEYLHELLTEAVNLKDETLHWYNVTFYKKMLTKSKMFKKTSKQFQQEVYDLLNLPFPELYEALKGVPLAPEVGTNTKTKLTLVK